MSLDRRTLVEAASLAVLFVCTLGLWSWLWPPAIFPAPLDAERLLDPAVFRGYVTISAAAFCAVLFGVLWLWHRITPWRRSP